MSNPEKLRSVFSVPLDGREVSAGLTDLESFHSWFKDMCDARIPTSVEIQELIQIRLEKKDLIHSQLQRGNPPEDLVELTKFGLHFLYCERDRNNLQIAIFRSSNDLSVWRTLQKTHALVVFEITNKWPVMLDKKSLKNIRQRCPQFLEATNNLKSSISAFNEKWRSELRSVRNKAIGHFDEVDELQRVWNSLRPIEYLNLMVDYGELVHLPIMTFLNVVDEICIQRLDALLERGRARS